MNVLGALAGRPGSRRASRARPGSRRRAAGPNRALMPAETEANRLACGRADEADRGGRAVLLVVGVEDEEQVERLGDGRGRPRTARPGRRTSSGGSSRRSRASCPGRGRAGRSTSCRRRRRWSAAWPAGGSWTDLDVLRVVRVEAVLVEGRQRGDGGGEDRHRVRVAGETVEEAACRSSCSIVWLLISSRNVVQLVARRELAVDEQVATSRKVDVARPAPRSGSRGSAGCRRRRR